MANRAEKWRNNEQTLRECIKILYSLLFPEKEGLEESAEIWSVDFRTASQAHSDAKGSAPLLLALLLGYFKVRPSQALQRVRGLRRFIPKLADPKREGKIEELVDEVRTRLSDPEFIAELKLLLVRDDLYRKQGLRKNPRGRPRKSV